MEKLFSVIDKVLTFFEEWTLFITVLAAMVALFINVIMRYFFNSGISWIATAVFLWFSDVL